jgi:hypothetical protein
MERIMRRQRPNTKDSAHGGTWQNGQSSASASADENAIRQKYLFFGNALAKRPFWQTAYGSTMEARRIADVRSRGHWCVCG